MKQVKLGIIACALLIVAGCNEMKPVVGASEVLVNENLKSTVHLQEDGTRLVIIQQGENITVVIRLPPLKDAEKKPN